MNKMKAIIKQFFLHVVGQRFFQSAKSRFKFNLFKNEFDKMLSFKIIQVLVIVIFSIFIFWIKYF